MFKKICSIGLILCLSSCSIIGTSNSPMMKYQTIKKQNNYSIREYESFIQAEINVQNNDYKKATREGFRELFNYIKGSNTLNKEISMMAPVLTERKIKKTDAFEPMLLDDIWTIAFILPYNYTIQNAPKTINKEISLITKKSKKIATISFSGFINKDSIEKNTQKLKKWIISNNLKVVGQAILAGYNPPWTISFLRTNEIWIPVK